MQASALLSSSSQFLTLDDAKRKLAEYKAVTKNPPPPLEAMTRAQVHIEKLRSLTRDLKNVFSPSHARGGTLTSPTSPMQGSMSSNGNNRGLASVRTLSPVRGQPEQPIIPHDKEAFLQQLHRHAVPDDEIRERYERMQAKERVKSLHLSFSATPPTGEYKGVLQGKTDAFQSNMGRFEKLSSLTPRSLAKQRSMGHITGGASSPGHHGDDEDDEEGGKNSEGQKDSMRALADSLAETRTDELLEKSIVLQSNKQDIQGNLSLKRAVQLAMAAQHTQQIESMKRTFEQRLHEAVKVAKDEGLIMGRKEGSDFARTQLDGQAAKVAELERHIAALQAVAQQSFVCKETTELKVQFVRDEKEKWLGMFHKFEDVDLDELVAKVTMYEEERKYLYSKAFRMEPDMDNYFFNSKKFALHSSTHPASTAGGSPRKPSSVAHRSRTLTREARALCAQRVQAILRFHEAACRQTMSMLDRDAS